jgi:ABC-type Zn2+ transport system substrate-binding protein/surface adhesin
MSRLLRKLAIAGLFAIVGFTTACPPPWYFRRHERRDDRRERHDDHGERHDDHKDRHERRERDH